VLFSIYLFFPKGFKCCLLSPQKDGWSWFLDSETNIFWTSIQYETADNIIYQIICRSIIASNEKNKNYGEGGRAGRCLRSAKVSVLVGAVDQTCMVDHYFNEDAWFRFGFVCHHRKCEHRKSRVIMMIMNKSRRWRMWSCEVTLEIYFCQYDRILLYSLFLFDCFFLC